MEMCFLSKGIYNYLDVNLSNEDRLKESGDFYKIKMIEENSIAYIINPLLSEVDGEITLRYNTGSFYVLDRMFVRLKPDGKLLKLIITQIAECMEDIENYLLSPDDLVINPEYMFYDGENKKISLIYVPGYKVPIKKQLKDFLEYIMKIFDHRDKNGISSLYGLYDYLMGEEADMSCIRQIFSREKIGMDNNKPNNDIPDYIYKAASKDSYEEAEYKHEKMGDNAYEDDLKQHFEAKQKNIIIGVIWGIAIASFFGGRYFMGGEIVNLYVFIGLLILIFMVAVLFLFKDEEDADEVMEEYNRSCGYNRDEINCIKENINDSISRIVPLTNGGLGSIELKEFTESIIIGRDKKDTDYRLPTTQISRIHACIYKTENAVYLEDRDSTNGTFLNHNRLPSLSKQKLAKGDIIGFANEEFFVS